MSKIFRHVILSEKKPCGTPVSHTGFVKSLKSQKCVSQVIFYNFQEFLRQLQVQFGLQLIRGLPNLKKTGVKVKHKIPRKANSSTGTSFHACWAKSKCQSSPTPATKQSSHSFRATSGVPPVKWTNLSDAVPNTLLYISGLWIQVQLWIYMYVHKTYLKKMYVHKT
jgi:hypothetical protein